jgi:hypothetical protein
MGRRHVDVATPALALRRAEAAASMAMGVEHFDRYVRPYVPAVRTAGVTTYPVAGLQRWLIENGAIVDDDLHGAA